MSPSGATSGNKMSPIWLFCSKKPAAPPEQPFAYRDILEEHRNEPVPILLADESKPLPDWLFRGGSFYKQSGGAFNLPKPKPKPPVSDEGEISDTGKPQIDFDPAFLDGLAHVVAWRFTSGQQRVMFSNGFADTEAYRLWKSSGGTDRRWAGTGSDADSGTYMFNPNVNFQRCENGQIAPCLIEAPLPVRMVVMDPVGLHSVDATRDLSAQLKSAEDWTGNPSLNEGEWSLVDSEPVIVEEGDDVLSPVRSPSLDESPSARKRSVLCARRRDRRLSTCSTSTSVSSDETPMLSPSSTSTAAQRTKSDPSPEDYKDDFVFVASHQLESPSRQSLYGAVWFRPSTDFTIGWRVYRMCHDKNSPSRCCRVLHNEVSTTVSWVDLLSNKIPPSICPPMMHTTVETNNFLLLPETSLRWRPDLTMKSSIFGRLPVVGKRYITPFFEQYEYHPEFPLAFRVYKKDAENGRIRYLGRMQLPPGEHGHLFHVANAFDEDLGDGKVRITMDSDWVNGWVYGKTHKVTDLALVRFQLEFDEQKRASSQTSASARAAESLLSAAARVAFSAPMQAFGECEAAKLAALAADVEETSAGTPVLPGRSTRQVLLKGSTGFACVNPRILTRPHRYVYTITDQAFSRLSKVDTMTGAITEWAPAHSTASHKWAVSEPQFVPKPAACTFSQGHHHAEEDAPQPEEEEVVEEEEEGLLLVAANDMTEEKSWLLILDPVTMAEVARVGTKVDVNYGLHSQFVGPESAEELPLKW